MAARGSAVIPCLRYRDVHVAIDCLCSAFGFERQAVNAAEDTVHHAQLSYGGGMVMLGSVGRAGKWGTQIAQPDEVGGRESRSSCVVVADADAHYATAKAAGAQIEIEISDRDYGSHGYACRDIEGHLWWFGSYDPWAEHTQVHAAADAGA